MRATGIDAQGRDRRTTADNRDAARRLVDRLTRGSGVDGLIVSSYLAGSRATPISRPDSDWDLTLVLRPDCADEELTVACAEIARRAGLRAPGDPPGEVSVPKLATLGAVRRCLQWDAATFGELFWHHALPLDGPEIRTGPLHDASARMRRLVARAAVGRGLTTLCYSLWAHTDGSGAHLNKYSNVVRILRALGYLRDGGFAIDPEANHATLAALCGLGPRDPILRAVRGGTRQGWVALPAADWARLIGLLMDAAGICGPEDLAGLPERTGPRVPPPVAEAEGLVWLACDRPVPWLTRWRLVDEPGELATQRPATRGGRSPGIPRRLADAQSRWAPSPYRRATFFSYLIYNQWNKIGDVLQGARGESPVFPGEALCADLDRLDYLLAAAPPGAADPRPASARRRAGQSAARFPAAWRELCAALEAAGDLAMPGDPP